jgi:hypothetical protein
MKDEKRYAKGKADNDVSEYRAVKDLENDVAC